MKSAKIVQFYVAIMVLVGLCETSWPVEGMISYWTFEEGSGTTAYDSIDGNHGTLMGGPIWTTGIVGGALSLDGYNDWVDCGPSENLNFGLNSFSFEFWVRFNSLQGEQVLIEKYVENWNNTPERSLGYGVAKMSDNSLAFYGWCLPQPATPSPPIVVDTWYHCVATRNVNTFSLYWNGSFLASGDNDHDLDTTSSFKIGHRGNPDDTPGSVDWRGFYLNGLIDEVAVYDRALTADEIVQHYQNGLNGQGYQTEPTAVTYDGDTLLSTGGAPTADTFLMTTLSDSEGEVLDIDDEQVTFTLTAVGLPNPIQVPAVTLDGIATAEEPLLPAIYDIEVTLSSWDLTASAILVIYNPEGGFATGGGWIVPVDDGLNSYPNVRANFGFNAKYKKDTSTGHLEFRYTNGFVDLKSDTVDLLVITGGKIAQFKGYATMNGQSGHWYFVKAIDNGEPGFQDTFEIKIWAPGTDPDIDEHWHRAGGKIQGGNIVVHK
jgi:hypothetical protein